MVISYLGRQFFKITQGDLTIAFNPSKEVDARFGADVVFMTTNHPDYNNKKVVTYGDKIPFIVSGPGEYEIKSIFAKGIYSETRLDKKKYINTIYSLEIDDIKLCFLGALSDLPSPKILKDIETPDILFVPVGGKDVLTPVQAYKLALSLEPKIIIPMDYTPSTLKAFLREGGKGRKKAEEKLVVKKKDLEEKEGEIIVLAH